MSNYPMTEVLRSALLVLLLALAPPLQALEKQIVYLTAKQDLPFWNTMGKGVKAIVQAQGFSYTELDSNLSAERQLQNARSAIAAGVAGIVLSPIDSKTAPEVLSLALQAKIPVVIADIGTNAGEYASYIKSDNYRGAFDIGVALAAALKEKGWQSEPYAIISISLARKNGQDRTNGFRDAMQAAGSGKEVALKQMQNYSADETFQFVSDIVRSTPTLRSMFIETDQPVQGAMQALKAARKNGEVLIVSFDAMPDVVELLNRGALVAVGMQQPYLMGSKAAGALIGKIRGEVVEKQILVPILVATNKNITALLAVANKTVFGIDSK